jgi:hypothetical protein
MKPTILSRNTFQTTLILAASTALGFSIHSLYAKPDTEKVMPGAGMMGGKPMPMNANPSMIEAHQQMMAEMTQKDSELSELIVKLNRAPQDQKITVLTDIVTRLVDQQTAMHKGMDRMHKMMVTCMMPMGANKSATNCPMNQNAEEKPDEPVSKAK